MVVHEQRIGAVGEGLPDLLQGQGNQAAGGRLAADPGTPAAGSPTSTWTSWDRSWSPGRGSATLDINNAPKEDTGKSAAQMVYGNSLTLPAQLASGEELPVNEILRDLSNAAPMLSVPFVQVGPALPKNPDQVWY
jgi:hypothetical protein